LDELTNLLGINPNYFMHVLSQCSNAAVSFVVDVGNHQMWAAQSLKIASHQVEWVLWVLLFLRQSAYRELPISSR
jgi:thiamine pyrophosphate-dependent acetolactate synthase large subunit-like protein